MRIALFLSEEGPMLETLDYTVLSVLAVHRPFYISICKSERSLSKAPLRTPQDRNVSFFSVYTVLAVHYLNIYTSFCNI